MVSIHTFVSVGLIGDGEDGELDRQAGEHGLAYFCNVPLPAMPPMPSSHCFPLRLPA